LSGLRAEMQWLRQILALSPGRHCGRPTGENVTRFGRSAEPAGRAIEREP